jgi:peptidoglycan/xylan/chitin deacetylase (PgdA/CDA1 family)
MTFPAKTKVAIAFDDGFMKSSLATAKLFESFGLRAVFSVLADRTNFAPKFDVGDFALWNELQSRGHIIHPHGWRHTKLSDVPYEQAIEEMQRCLDSFAEHLSGFVPSRAVYHYAYNAGAAALNEWLLQRVAAVRQNGSGFLSAEQLRARLWHSTTFGPDDPAEHFMSELQRCASERPAAFFYTLHGLDGEAWGAIAQASLGRALELITSHPTMQYSTLPFD